MSRAIRIIVALLLVLLSAPTPAQTASSGNFIWTGGTCCGQDQPKYIHAPQALTQYYNSMNWPSQNGCTSAPTALGQTCCVLWYSYYCVDYHATTETCAYPSVNSITGCVCNAPNYLVNGVCTEPVFCVPPQVPVNGVCQYVCPVDSLPKPPPPFDDACSQALEDHGGRLSDPTVCPNFDVAKNNLVAKCVASKLGSTTMPITATYRTDPYQKHLWDIWSRAVYLRVISYSFLGEEIKQACAVSKVNADVQAELQHHGNLSSPTKTAGSHGESRAIDIPYAVVDALQKKAAALTVTTISSTGKRITTVGMDVEAYINSTTANPTPECNANANANPPRHIQWGWNFKNSPRDIVHFQFP